MAIPVILDTDLGLDVDDVWALAFMLCCPELDVRLIVSSTGDTRYGASLIAKLLEIAGRPDIPVGIGVAVNADRLPKTHAQWLGDYDIEQYNGRWHEDGVGALVDTVLESPQPVSIIEIGPTRNLAEALTRAPEITENASLIGMLGSLRRGYHGAPEPAREYNVFADAASCQAVLSAPWPKTIVPLDSCGTVTLRGERFNKLQEAPSALVDAVLENHFCWVEAVREWPMMKDFDPQLGSSMLYDTVPVYLAFAEDLLKLESQPVTVTDDGWTRIDPAGHNMRCATDWVDQEAFQDFLLTRFTQY